VISPMVVGREEMRELLERPYVGTAGAAVPSLLLPALEMTGNSGRGLFMVGCRVVVRERWMRFMRMLRVCWLLRG
jgi:hypothetical protein